MSSQETFTGSSFKPNVCVDWRAHLKKIGAAKCKKCNMRRIGKRRKRK